MAIAWWLNIGVQVFFCISGWLYGGKKITGPTTWIWKNYVKILVDVLVFLVVTLPVYYVCADGLTVYDIIKSFFVVFISNWLCTFMVFAIYSIELFVNTITPILVGRIGIVSSQEEWRHNNIFSKSANYHTAISFLL